MPGQYKQWRALRARQGEEAGLRTLTAGYGGADEGAGGGYSERPQPASRPAAAAKAAPKSSTGFDNMDDDIPF